MRASSFISIAISHSPFYTLSDFLWLYSLIISIINVFSLKLSILIELNRADFVQYKITFNNFN